MKTGCVQGFAAKQAQPVHVPKMGVRQEHRTKRRMPPRAKLVAQRSGGFDEMSVAVFIDDAQAHRVPNVFRAQSGATRSLTARLRTPAILGDSEQGDRRHGPDHAEVEHEPFHAKVSNPTTKPEGLREQRASTVQS